MANAPELLSRLQEVSRCMESPFPCDANEIRIACSALADATEAESPEIAAAGGDLAKAAERDLAEGDSNLCLHLRLETLMARIQTAAESSRAGHVWASGQNLTVFVRVVGEFLDDAPEPCWAEEFPAAISALDAVRIEMRNLGSLVGWPAPPDRFGLEEINQALRYSGELTDSAPEAKLCQYLDSARQDLVRETHGAWIESHLRGREETSPVELYTWYWNETLGDSALDDAKVEESAATVSNVAKAMGLDEVADYVDDPDQVTYYGLESILPATPIRWNLDNGEAASRHLHSSLARWYYSPLAPSLDPLDLIIGVLGARRPFYYHRMLAHALMQTVCVQRILPVGMMTDAVVGKLAAFCDLMLDGYHQRCQYLPMLKTTQTWVEYLNALMTLHFPNGQEGRPCAISGSGPRIYPELAKVLYGRPN